MKEPDFGGSGYLTNILQPGAEVQIAYGPTSNTYWPTTLPMVVAAHVKADPEDGIRGPWHWPAAVWFVYLCVFMHASVKTFLNIRTDLLLAALLVIVKH
jgi:hypothetical protein